MRHKYLPIGAVVGLLFALLITAVYAQDFPVQPFRLFGDVTATDGDVAVVAQVPGAPCVKAALASTGRYGISPDFFNVPTDNPITSLKEGGVSGDIVTVVVGPNEPSTIPFDVGGIGELNVTASTSQVLSATLTVSGARLSWTATGSVRDRSTGAAVSGATVNVNWGDSSSCSEPTSTGAGLFTASHTYSAASQFDVTAVAFKSGAAAHFATSVVNATLTTATPVPPAPPPPPPPPPPVATATPTPTESPTPTATATATPTPTESPEPTETPEAVSVAAILDLPPDEAGEKLAELAQEDPEAFVASIARASEEDRRRAGVTLAVRARSDPDEVGRTLTAAALENPEIAGLAIAAASQEDAESTGEALASAARDNPEAIGDALISAADEDAESTGNAIAEAAEEDSDAIGNALLVAVKKDAKAINKAIKKAAKRNAKATGEALNKGVGADPEALAALGEDSSVEAWVKEDDREEGPDTNEKGEWETVGSPAPIERILARYATAFPQAKVVVADVLELPAGVPSLPAGRKLNSLLTLTPDGFTNEDIFTAHATLFVEKSWLEANQVHEWSVQFSRFDQEQSAWRPATAKRVRKDQERVFFSVVIPGFSLWAISGSEEVPEVEFRVDDLTITPASAPEGEPVTIQVQATNLTAEAAEFNIALWLNSLVNTTKAVPVAPNATVPVTFTVQSNEGSYEVRIDRLLGNLVVGPAVPVVTIAPVAVAVPAVAVEAPEVAPTPVAPEPEVTPAVIPPPERGVGVIVGVIVGALVAVGVVGTVVAIYLGGREPLPTSPSAGPPEEDEPPAAVEAEGSPGQEDVDLDVSAEDPAGEEAPQDQGVPRQS